MQATRIRPIVSLQSLFNAKYQLHISSHRKYRFTNSCIHMAIWESFRGSTNTTRLVKICDSLVTGYIGNLAKWLSTSYFCSRLLHCDNRPLSYRSAKFLPSQRCVRSKHVEAITDGTVVYGASEWGGRFLHRWRQSCCLPTRSRSHISPADGGWSSRDQNVLQLLTTGELQLLIVRAFEVYIAYAQPPARRGHMTFVRSNEFGRRIESPHMPHNMGLFRCCGTSNTFSSDWVLWGLHQKKIRTD